MSETLRNGVASLQREVDALDANRLLNTAPEDLKRHLAQKYGVTPIKLLRDQWYADHKEVQVDVRHDPMRRIRDANRPLLVSGERIEVGVPYEGESELFYPHANTRSSNPPSAIVEGNELVLRYDSPSDSPREVRPLVDQLLTEIEQHIGCQRSMINEYNVSLPNLADQAIQERQARLLA